MITIIDKTTPIAADLGTINKSIFLAGPSPRGSNTDWKDTWREQAVLRLKSLGFNGHVFIPLPFGDMEYEEGVLWEDHFLNIADQILFWVPRTEELPGFTTNVEFGEWMDSGKVVLGFPEDAYKTRYLESKAKKFNVPVYHYLHEALRECVNLLGPGADRVGGEIYVPLHIWRSQYFQAWYGAQKAAGNRLVRGKLLWEFRIVKLKRTFAWIYKAEIHVASEDRIKSNEFVFTRSDIASIVAYCPGKDLLSTRVLTVREFRVPARTFDGFVHELPGGSSFKDGEDPKVTAAHELEEETGLKIDPTRFLKYPARQLAATLSSHVAHIFAVELTEEEMQSVNGTKAGVAADTEITYVGVATFEDILRGKVPFDLSSIGMIGVASLADEAKS
jgi:8-oxo-dGTP pyrophosphatase MutT (NUDIX family)